MEFCTPLRAAGEQLLNTPAAPSPDCVLPPSSPRAGGTRSLVFVQETGHIESIFKEYLEEGTEHGQNCRPAFALGCWQR